MYTCEDTINLLLDYLDGEMPAEEAKHLKEHLSGCAPCIDFLRTYRATPGLCRRALAQKMPQEVSAKLTEFLRTRIKSAS
ncbi:MAG TPA: anti-sigma factor [Myxococcaceae bacterium]|nr:anti-sigma factor [Myxococcaceae bacterium]